MDFNVSEDHRLLADSLAHFFANETNIERRNHAAFAPPFYDRSLWSGLVELGVAGAFLPPEAGGWGGTAEDVAIIFEAAGRALSVEPLLATLSSVRLLVACGRQDLADQVVSGATLAAFAVSEPVAGEYLCQMQTHAIREASGWALSGQKTAIAASPESSMLLVPAVAGGRIGLFLTGTEELRVGPAVEGGGFGRIRLENTPAICLADDAMVLIEETLDLARIALCAEAIGAMDHLLGLTIVYLRERRQFGQVLGNFQALQHRLVDMRMEYEQARSITMRAVASFPTVDRPRHVAMAKLLIGRAGKLIAEEAIQLHGGLGMSWEFDGAHYAKRLLAIDHQLGSRSEHLRRLTEMGAAATA